MGLLTKGQQTTPKKVIQKNSPPSWSKSLLEQGAQDAQNLYLAQKDKNTVYQGDRISDLSDQTKQSIKGLNDLANLYQNSYAKQAINDTTSSEKNLKDLSQGKGINANPYFEESLNQSLNQAADIISSKMSAAGRLGSGANTKILSNTLGEIAQKAQENQYNQDINTMMNANQIIDKMQTEKLNSINNYYKGQGESLLNMLMGGQILDKNSQSKLDAEKNKWYETQQSGWNLLNQLLSAGKNSSDNYKIQETIAQSSQRNQKEDDDALKMFSKALPFLAKSDRRAKKNIRFHGYKNSYPTYIFQYIGNKNYYLGVIAQDIQSLNPSAVVIDPFDGLLMVDYKKIGFSMKKVSLIFRIFSKIKNFF